MRNVRRGAAQAMLAAAVLVLASHVASAEDCQLKQVASLDTLTSNDGDILVPVGIENASGYLILDISNTTSMLTRAAADSVHLKAIAIPAQESVNYNGLHANLAAPATIKLGNASGNTMFAILDGTLSDNARAAGVLGYDLLKHFDIELDLAHNKVNLFLQDHCPGKVVYWSHTAAIAAAPIRVLNLAALNIPMQLDGKDVDAQISTSAPYSLLHRHVARVTFAIDSAAGDAPEASGTRNDSSNVPKAQPYSFKALTLDGITISNPVVYPYGKDGSYICNGTTHEEPAPLRSEMRQLVTCYGEPDMFLGRSVLSQLRVYIALKERMLYATAANAQ